MTQQEYDVAFDLEYNTGSSKKYLDKLADIKKLESNGKSDKAADKRKDLSKWLEKQYPGRDKKRGTSRILMFDGAYSPKQSLLEEVIVEDKRIKE